ncbi:MAG TPA: hypothetical protein PLR69_08285 [Candidatus Limiplasma sp.]|nr:hypothetical protein [Candidatus Limiplasma sp.]
MIAYTLKFSPSEIEGFFRKHGCIITRVTTRQHVPAYHNKTTEQLVTTTCVVNPLSQQAVPIDQAFERVMDSIKHNFFLVDIDVLKVLNSFKSN